MYVEKKKESWAERKGVCKRQTVRDSCVVVRYRTGFRAASYVTYLEVPLSAEPSVMTEVMVLRLAAMLLSSFFILR
jgi:predicted DNA repair protein MutK